MVFEIGWFFTSELPTRLRTFYIKPQNPSLGKLKKHPIRADVEK
jgi:hypothetical protein